MNCTNRKCVCHCFRQGLKCTLDELTASAFLTVKLDDSMGGAPVQVSSHLLMCKDYCNLLDKSRPGTGVQTEQ